MKKYILLFALTIQASISFAQNQNSSNDVSLEIENDTVKKKGQVIEEVVITSNRIKRTGSVAKTGISVKDLPQSIQEIGSEVITQQQSVRLSDVVKNINGVYVSSARGGAQESFYGRGYDLSANNMFKNGFRFNSGSIPEVSSLEKVEVLKGSAALLFGNVSPGGILNMVTKMPSFKSGGEIGMQMGSYSFYKPSIDFYGPLNSFIAYRFVGSYENSESFRDVVKKERYYLNPSFLFKLSSKTEMVLQGDFMNDNWTPDFGTGIIGKKILDLPRNAYLGATWSNGNTKQTTVSNLLTHTINSNWKFNFNSSFQHFNRTSKGTERVQPSEGTPLVEYGYWKRPLGQNKNVEKIVSNQASLQGNFNTGKVKHQFFTGLDFENAFTDAYTFVFTPATYGEGNVFDFENFDQGGAIPDARNSKIVKTDTKRFGVYAQDLISITDKIKFLGGLRWSWQEAQADTYNYPTTGGEVLTEGAKRKDVAFTPKAGLVYQPVTSVSIFASYANSFTPNSGTNVNLETLEASIIDQFEVGVKKEFFDGKLTSNVTLYQIENSNLAQTAEFKADGSLNTDTSIKVLGGGTRSKGIEIDITAKPVEGLNIIAGYSYNDMRYIKTSGTNGSFIEGDRVARTPQNTANLSFFYTLPSGALKGLSFGAIGNYVGDRLGGWNDDYQWKEVPSGSGNYTITIRDRDIPIEGYTTVDASVGYTWKKLSVLVKLSNITNELNYTVHENYSVNPIAPRQVLGSIKYKF
ncbi:TonB-dependent siderophore receptor [Flavobacterium terrigena]|uniref:Iron complex outermembrane recepter protein n=1 Tax=Flavobacterium terrigena TaxID=402734 RepID=A0A1H6QWM6_9FLAO|nr:TonB-dependent receptor [Flavobacterium terrigena]SEI43890.1 iron complex outermembrane recepter protein [Flavobacterium terrigena]